MKAQSSSWYSESEVWHEAREWEKNKKEIERSITTPPSSSPFLFFFLMDVGTTPTIWVTGTGFENLYQRTFSHALIFLTYTLYVAYFRHYPTTKFTAVADTPENKRLAANTKKQSNVSPFFLLFCSNLLLSVHYRPESSLFSFVHWAGENIISKWLKFLLTFL